MGLEGGCARKSIPAFRQFLRDLRTPADIVYRTYGTEYIKSTRPAVTLRPYPYNNRTARIRPGNGQPISTASLALPNPAGWGPGYTVHTALAIQ